MCILTEKKSASAAAAEIKTQHLQQQQTQQHYNDLFHLLAVRLRSSSSPSSSHSSSSSPGVGVWQVQQEKTPHCHRAYLQVSRLNWHNYNMNGIHLEAYVLDDQINSKEGIVALHCESEWPLEFRKEFVSQLTERIRGRLEGWSCYREYGTWKLMMGHNDNDDGVSNNNLGMMSVCEVRVPFGVSPDETMERIERQLRRLMTLSPDIDHVIDHCWNAVMAEQENSSSSLVLTKEQVRKNDGLEGRPLWTVIDGYVVDCTEFAKFHPGGLRKILATDEKQTGWTGEEFGFSLSRGKNAHFPQTRRVFQEGTRRFDELQSQVEVNFGKDGGGAITILGKLHT
jgi:hypothetical protein